MSDQDDQEIRLRDQIAMQVLGHLIQADYIRCYSYERNSEEMHTCKFDQWTMDSYTATAYKFADSMRKARMKVFK
jgi:hypothetical protein